MASSEKGSGEAARSILFFIAFCPRRHINEQPAAAIVSRFVDGRYIETFDWYRFG